MDFFQFLALKLTDLFSKNQVHPLCSPKVVQFFFVNQFWLIKKLFPQKNLDHRPAPKRFSKNVSVLSYPRQKPSLVCIIPKRWSPCPLLLSRRHIKVKLPPLRLAGANFWPTKIHPSCQILTNLALCALFVLEFYGPNI